MPSARTSIFPVLFASGLGNIGSDEVLDFIVDYVPTAIERGTVKRRTGTASKASRQSRKIGDSEPLSIFVFKTDQRSLCRAHLVLQGRLRAC